MIKAYEKQIENHLINLAKEKGFKKGVTINNLHFHKGNYCPRANPFKLEDKYETFSYNFENNILRFGGAEIYENGHWAIIVEDEFKIFMKNKKIIGYKAPYDIDTVVPIKKGDTLIPWEGGYIKDTGNWLPKQIVEQWKPIYEEEKITIGEYEVNIHKSKIEIQGDYYSKEELVDLKNFLNRHSSQVKSLNVGCKGKILIELSLINRILDRMKEI